MSQTTGRGQSDKGTKGSGSRGRAHAPRSSRAVTLIAVGTAVAFLSAVACSSEGVQGKNLEGGKGVDASAGRTGSGTSDGLDGRADANDKAKGTTADANTGGTGDTTRPPGSSPVNEGGATNTVPTTMATVAGTNSNMNMNMNTNMNGGSNTPGNTGTGGDMGTAPVPKTLAEMVVSGPQLIASLPVSGAFTEGPLWHPSGYLLFSEHKERAIWKWTPGSSAKKVRSVDRKSNGLTFDAEGNLVACEDAETTVARLAAQTGARTILASKFQNKTFNGPNDCIVDSKGAIYFTDPWYGLGGRTSEIGAFGLYRVATDGAVTQISTDFVNTNEGGRGSPNGLGLSPDESTLYVANTGGNAILSFARGADGSYGSKAAFASVSKVPELQQPDGLKVSVQGHVIVGVKEGVLILNPDGTKFGFVRVRKDPAGPDDGPAVGAVSNVAFGGPNFQSLFLTSNEKLFRIELAVKGARPWNFTSALPDPLPQ